MSDRWQDDVRVHYAGDPEVSYLEQERRTEAQKIQDQILDKATEAATDARERVTEALDWLAVIKPSAHRNLPVVIGQLIEEIEELRRVRQ